MGTDHDTAAFAVATIRRWWQSAAACYPTASRLLITAEGGGSNGCRTPLCKGGHVITLPRQPATQPAG